MWTYDVGMGRCRACGRRWRAKHLQLPPDQTGGKAHRVGPEAHTTAVTTSILHSAAKRIMDLIETLRQALNGNSTFDSIPARQFSDACLSFFAS